MYTLQSLNCIISFSSYAYIIQVYIINIFIIRYACFPGPAFWGLINPEWSLCNKGRRQSPVNLDPEKLLYDPNLTELHVDRQRVSRCIFNILVSLTIKHITIAMNKKHIKISFHVCTKKKLYI